MRDIDTLRNHLFDTLEALRNANNPMDLDRAQRIADVARVIVDSAKAENDYLRITGKTGSGFVPEQPAMPNTPRLVKGRAQSGSA